MRQTGIPGATCPHNRYAHEPRCGFVYDDYRAHDDYSYDNDDLDNNLDDILG